MASIVQGRIIYALDPIPDREGRNPKKNRPFVVLSTDDELKLGDDLFVVAISHTVVGAAEEVELQWGRNSLTHLPTKSAAICDWTTTLTRSRVDVRKGFVRPVYLREILQKVALYSGESEPPAV